LATDGLPVLAAGGGGGQLGHMLPRFRCLLGVALLGLAATVAPAAQFRALLITETAGFHHSSISAAVPALQDLAKLHHFDLVWTANAGSMMKDEKLAEFDVVIFLLTTGSILNEEQRGAMERFIQSGKGFVGVHSASDTHYDWEWYRKMVGYMFHIHPAIQTGTMQVEEPNFPGMDRFAKRFLFTEEWYEFGPPEGSDLTVLLTVDEDTYAPKAGWGAKTGDGMGEFHPVAWFHEYDGGRAFYSALGHLPATYRDANFMHHLYGGIYWAATGKGFRVE
jgi:type 1 glutamine amidotransferase